MNAILPALLRALPRAKWQCSDTVFLMNSNHGRSFHFKRCYVGAMYPELDRYQRKVELLASRLGLSNVLKVTEN